MKRSPVEILKQVGERLTGRIRRWRSSRWPALVKAHLARRPSCEACGSQKKVQVHHIRPVHLYPAFEEDPDNLLSLCRSKARGIDCHRVVGHGGSWFKWNPQARHDAADMLQMFKRVDELAVTTAERLRAKAE